MLKSFCREHFVSKGMCVDFAIHDKGDSNPHAHIMLTMRATAVQSELKQLKDVRFYVSKALPEEKPVLGKEEKRSITQRLHENRERINQEQAQKKNKSRKRSDMEL